jgi:hypothetical protein
MSAVLSRYAPEFAVRIGGEAIPAALRAAITGVRYEDGVPSMVAHDKDDDGAGAADRVEIDIANVDLRWLARHIRGLGFRPIPTDLKIGPLRAKNASAMALGAVPGVMQMALSADTPEGLFDIDNKLSLEMGYAGEGLQPMFRGEITGVEADFPSSGMPALKVVAHDYLHRLSNGTYARGFSTFIPDWLVAAILGAENLLVPLIDPVVGAASTALTVLNAIFRQGGRAQRGSDLDLLKEIAATYDADFWVDGDVLYLSRVLGKEFEPRLTLAWGESLLSFAPRVTTIGQVIGVAVKFTLPLIPFSFVMTVSWDFDREALLVRVIPGAVAGAIKSVLGGPVLSLINRKLQTPGDIANAALAITRLLRNKVNNRLTASGSAVGDPRLRAGAVVRIDGVGPDFSGNYRITSATHTMDAAGYRTAFKARREILP